jgi:hypothetical protein
VDCNSCKSTKYPYTGCCQTPTGHERCSRCSNDPFNETGFRAFKKCNLNTSLIDYITTGFPFGGGIEWSDPTIPAQQKTIISISDANNDAYDALLDWILACLPDKKMNEHDCDECRLKIIWARKKEEMYGYPNALGVTFQPIAGVSGDQKCEVDCDHAVIAINATNEFMGGIDPNLGQFPDITQPTFFYTNKNTANKSDLNWYHYKTVILHEIGHWLGIGDMEGSCIPSGATQASTVMYQGLSAMQERDVLSDADKCAFMLLYCCDNFSDVEVNQESFEEIKVFPNPTNNDLINIQFCNPMGINMAYEIISPLGYSVSSDDIHYNENPKTIILGNLASGVYYIILKHDGIQETKKFIISK